MTCMKRMLSVCLVVMVIISCGRGMLLASSSKGEFDSSKFLKDYAGQMTIGCKNARRSEESLILGAHVERNNKLHLDHFTGVQPAYYPAFQGSWPNAMPDDVSRFTFNPTGLGEHVNWAAAHDQPTLHHLLIASNNYFPEWFWDAEYSPEELDQILKAYITAMVTDDNAKRVDVWNVFNEMFQNNRKLGKYKEDGTGRKNAVWMRMGYEADRSGLQGGAKVNDQHPIIFRKTLEYASIASGKLEIRENEVAEINRKSDALYQLVRHLLNSGVRVDVVGFQGHLYVDRSYDWESVKENIKRFRDLGVEVYITELDVSMSGAYGWNIGDPFPDNYAERQYDYYYNMVRVAREAGVSRIDVWGLSDGVKHFWKEGHKARLLDENFERRPQYEAVLRALYDTME